MRVRFPPGTLGRFGNVCSLPTCPESPEIRRIALKCPKSLMARGLRWGKSESRALRLVLDSKKVGSETSGRLYRVKRSEARQVAPEQKVGGRKRFNAELSRKGRKRGHLARSGSGASPSSGTPCKRHAPSLQALFRIPPSERHGHPRAAALRFLSQGCFVRC